MEIRPPKSVYFSFLGVVLSGWVWLFMGDGLALRAFGSEVPATLSSHVCERVFSPGGTATGVGTTHPYIVSVTFTARVAGKIIPGDRTAFGFTQNGPENCERYAREMFIERPLTASYWPDDPAGSLTIMLDGAWDYVALAALLYVLTAAALLSALLALVKRIRRSL